MNLKVLQNVIIVEHEANDVGPGHVLIRYFNERKIDELVYIGHPNLYMQSGFKKSSRMVRFHKGNILWEKTSRHWILPEWVLYIKDCIYTIYWIFFDKHTYDVFIGLGNINALCGIFLKKIGKVNKVVYYVIDYIPNRFENKMLNLIYVWAERFAASWSDNTWNLSNRMIEARNNRWKMNFPNQFVVPHGLYVDKKKILPYTKIHKHELIYMGNLNEEQGVQLVIKSIKELISYIPNISFTIIGTGNYEKELKNLTKKNHLEDHVQFLGRIQDNKQMEKRLGRAALAVAMYNPEHKFSMYSDPGKIKHYLSVGLPIIMTDLPQVAEKIDHYCGEVIPYNQEIFINTVMNILRNQQLFKRYRKNAIILAKRYDWNLIFEEALHNLLSADIKAK